MTLTHLDLDRIEGLAGRLTAARSRFEAYTDTPSVVYAVPGTDRLAVLRDDVLMAQYRLAEAASDLTAMITRIRELEGALELPDADSLINISVKNGVLLSITVGANVLVNAVKYDPLLVAFDEHGESYEPEVTDVAKWLDAIITALRSEEEDGTTLVHRMLDKAAIEAIESGAEGIKTGDDLKDEHRARTALQRKTP